MKGKEYIRGCGKEIRAQRKTIRDLPRGAHTGGYRKLGRWNLGKHARRRPRLQANAHFHRRGRGIPIHRGFFGNYPIFLGSRLPLSDSASCTCRTRQPSGWLMGGPRSWLAACQASLASAAGWAGFPCRPHAAARPFGTLLGRVPARTRTRPQLASGFPGRCAVLRDKGVSRLLSALPAACPNAPPRASASMRNPTCISS